MIAGNNVYESAGKRTECQWTDKQREEIAFLKKKKEYNLFYSHTIFFSQDSFSPVLWPSSLFIKKTELAVHIWLFN